MQENHIATSSYDGTIKVWDMRSTIPLYTLAPNPDADEPLKLFDVDWNGSVLAGGGEDSKVNIYTSNN